MNKHIFKKVLKRWGIVAFCVLFFILLLKPWSIKTQIMKSLNYDVTLNEDGSATIVETWEIYLSNTNTIFKTFKKSDKFGDIIDVKVKDLDSNKELTQIYSEMYHVTTDCYYALDIRDNKFEVAWGTGMEEKIGTKRYEFTYTVTDVIADYNDCQEFYWKFLDTSNAIPVSKVTGTIRLPSDISDTNNLKIWGHGPLNGNIYKNGSDKVEFTVNDLRMNKMLEVRVVTVEKLFQANSHKNYNNLANIIKEETEWVYKADNTSTVFWIIVIGIYIVFIVINICKIVKYYKISKMKNSETRKLKYFREIPREDTVTPGEAAYLYYFTKSNMYLKGRESNIVAATILDLALKGYITLRMKKKDVCVKIIKEPYGLKTDERAVYDILKHTSKDEEFKIKEINTFAKEKYSKYKRYVDKLINAARESLYNLKLVDKANEREYIKSEKAEFKLKFLRTIVEFTLIGFLIGLIPIFQNIYFSLFGIDFVAEFIVLALILFPGVLSLFMKYITLRNAQPKIAILTPSGTEEREKWKALARYLNDFSLMNEKEVPSLEIWEKYLVYATAFGMADKVIEQMKAEYPEVFVREYWQDETVEKYHILNFVADNNDIPGKSNISVISHNTERAYRTSLSEIARHNSSDSSGGGRWRWRLLRRRWRPVVAEVGMGGR